MPRHLPALVVLLSLVEIPAVAYAQTPGPKPDVMTGPVGLIGAGVRGVVRDEAGRAVSGASILAMGATLAAVTSDSRGRFLLLLAPGEYILRAAREGYLSTVREAVRVHTQPVERDITLTSLHPEEGRQPGPDAETGSVTAAETDHSHSELAWRLRHMPRSVLREQGASPESEDRDGRALAINASLFDWVFESSARAATSFFAETDFYGQVDLLTSSMMSGEYGEGPASWPRGVASVLVGAPVGSHGEWSIRAALAADERASWTLVGDYQARPERTHAFRLGVSYSSQASVTAKAAQPSIAAPGSRQVGGAYLFDRWRARSDVTLEYGLRMDRYDYLADTNLVSPSVGVRLALMPAASVTARASRRLLAPGAAEFLPPSSAGPWLPPQRTFSTLTPDAPLRPEAVDRFEMGLEYAMVWPVPLLLRVGRHVEAVENQVATLFGLDAEREVGHYYVATAGSPRLEAWVVGVESDLGQHGRAAISYTRGQSRWRGPLTETPDLPAGARPVTGEVADLVVSLDGRVPRSATQLAVAYRLNSQLLRPGRPDRPVAKGRFNLEVRQQLPYQPIHGGQLDLVLAVRTLFTATADQASFYDELLTVAPPTRLVCGVQVKF